MLYLRLTVVALLLFCCSDSFGQFWKRHKKEQQEEVMDQPTSLNPSYARKEYAPKASRKAVKGPTYGLQQEFYERMEELEKVRRKNEKLMEKPQYSNPLYFGHKRPPKKRKASKMKFCKECGIRH